MRFAAVFAALLSLGSFVAAAPTPAANAVSARSDAFQIAVRSASTLNDVFTAAQDQIGPHADALTEACKDSSVTYDDLKPHLDVIHADVVALVHATVAVVANVQVGVSVLGLINVYIGVAVDVFVALFVGVFVKIVLALYAAVSVCVDVKADVLVIVNLLVGLIAKIEVCSPGIHITIGVAVKVAIAAYVNVFAAIGLLLSVLGL